jgi:hypothetical protein
MHSSHILQHQSVAPIVSQCRESLLEVGPVHCSHLASRTCIDWFFGFTLIEPQVLDAQREYPPWIAADLPCFEALRRFHTPPCEDGQAQFVQRDYMRAFVWLVLLKVQVCSVCREFNWHNAV